MTDRSMSLRALKPRSHLRNGSTECTQARSNHSASHLYQGFFSGGRTYRLRRRQPPRDKCVQGLRTTLGLTLSHYLYQSGMQELLQVVIKRSRRPRKLGRKLFGSRLAFGFKVLKDGQPHRGGHDFELGRRQI